MRFENIERINIPTYLVICISPLLHVDNKFEPYYVSRTFIKYTETTQYIPDQILAQYRILSNWSRNESHLPHPLPHILGRIFFLPGLASVYGADLSRLQGCAPQCSFWSKSNIFS